MTIRVASYNVEFFDELFRSDNTMSTDADDRERLDALASVLPESADTIAKMVEETTREAVTDAKQIFPALIYVRHEITVRVVEIFSGGKIKIVAAKI